MAKSVPSTLSAINEAENPVELLVALTKHFFTAPDVAKYHCILLNKPVEIMTLNGKRSYKFAEAYAMKAEAMGFEGDDLDAYRVVKAVAAEDGGPIWAGWKPTATGGRVFRFGLRSADWDPKAKKAQTTANATDF